MRLSTGEISLGKIYEKSEMVAITAMVQRSWGPDRGRESFLDTKTSRSGRNLAKNQKPLMSGSYQKSDFQVPKNIGRSPKKTEMISLRKHPIQGLSLSMARWRLCNI